MKKPKTGTVFIEKATGKLIKESTWKRSVAQGGKKYARYFASKKAISKAEKQSRQTAREISRTEKRIAKIGKRIKAEAIRRKQLSEEARKSRKAIGGKIKKLRATRKKEIARRSAAKKRAKIVNKILDAIRKEKERAEEVRDFIISFHYRRSGRSFDVLATGRDEDEAAQAADSFLRHNINGQHIPRSGYFNWDREVIEGNRSPARAKKAEYRAESSD